MAKLDFCYTFYDGDAAKDTQFLDRLQRGAYYDILSAQRRFGHLCLERIRQILAGDFDHCWPALQLLLSVDDLNNFFIVWLDESVSKSQKHSTKQKENVSNRYKNDSNKLPNSYQTTTNDLPNKKMVIPLEDEYENKEENTLGKRVQGENPLQTQAEKPVLQKMLDIVKRSNANHISDAGDFEHLRKIAEKLADGELDLNNANLLNHVLKQFEQLYQFAMADSFYSKFSLSTIEKQLSSINQAKNSKNGTGNRKNTQQLPEHIDYSSSFNRGC